MHAAAASLPCPPPPPSPQSLRPSLQSLHSDSSQLSEAIGRASNLAESVSSKVRILDLAKVCMNVPILLPLCLWYRCYSHSYGDPSFAFNY